MLFDCLLVVIENELYNIDVGDVTNGRSENKRQKRLYDPEFECAIWCENTHFELSSRSKTSGEM